MAKQVDLVGRRYGELIVVAKLPKEEWRKDNHTLYDCLCSCGKHTIKTSNNLKHAKSCGCFKGRKYGRDIQTRHFRLYQIWQSMRRRCNSKKDVSYLNYGARGISVCKEWDDFNAFMEWAYSNGYTDEATRKECTLDRINPNGNYEPSNCRWTNSGVQGINRRKKDNKSGARGIWLTKSGKYHAVISVNNKRHCLGTFERIEDAVAARHEAEMKYFGIEMEA